MSLGAQDAFLDNGGGSSYHGDILSIPMPHARCLLSRSHRCLGRECNTEIEHRPKESSCSLTPYGCLDQRNHTLYFHTTSAAPTWGVMSRG